MPKPGQQCKTPQHRLMWLCHVCVTATPNAVKVASVLSSHCSIKTGLVTLSRKSIADFSGIDESNVSHALAALKKMGVIKAAEKQGRKVPWILLYPQSIGVAADTYKGVAGYTYFSATHYRVSKRLRKKETLNTQSPTLHSATQNPWSVWRPDREQEQDFYKISGLTKLELNDQIRKFQKHNIAKPEDFDKERIYWRRWCEQIARVRSTVNDTGHIDVTGQDQSTQSINSSQADLAEILQAPFECWKRVGPHVDPSKDPKKFIARGCCSRKADPCTCTVEQRKLIVERLKQCPRRR